jgi:hypothetical protein
MLKKVSSIKFGQSRVGKNLAYDLLHLKASEAKITSLHLNINIW